MTVSLPPYYLLSQSSRKVAKMASYRDHLEHFYVAMLLEHAQDGLTLCEGDRVRSHECENGARFEGLLECQCSLTAKVGSHWPGSTD